MSKQLWQETPLIYSSRISSILGSSAYLKLENLHPSHSFKFRGISLFVQKAKENHGPSVHLVIASGGNAGLAAACAARTLSVRCTVYIPEGVTQTTLDLLRLEKAEVIVIGRHYAEALIAAKDVVARETDAVMVPAYDDAILWEGHSSMIKEISQQLQTKPDAIFCSVGGGGLLGGIIVGCRNVSWDDVPIVALETIGSNCFYHTLSLSEGRFNCDDKVLPSGVELIYDEANNIKLAHFNQFTSQASGSLGASQPSIRVVKMALEREGGVKSVSVPDGLSMQVLDYFANDHKFLVELACSTTLAAAYKPVLFDKLVPPRPQGENQRTVVFIVCGGFKVSSESMVEYRKFVEDDAGSAWQVLCDDGKELTIDK